MKTQTSRTPASAMFISPFSKIKCIIEPSGGEGGVYIGSTDAVSDLALLSKCRISAVIRTIPGKGTHDKRLIKDHLDVPAEDTFGFNLYKYFAPSLQFIDRNRSEGRSILVYCLTGTTRSAAIVIAYLIATQGMTFEEAFDFVKEKRKLVRLNKGFQFQLKEWEIELQGPVRKVKDAFDVDEEDTEQDKNAHGKYHFNYDHKIHYVAPHAPPYKTLRMTGTMTGAMGGTGMPGGTLSGSNAGRMTATDGFRKSQH